MFPESTGWISANLVQPLKPSLLRGFVVFTLVIRQLLQSVIQNAFERFNRSFFSFGTSGKCHFSNILKFSLLPRGFQRILFRVSGRERIRKALQVEELF